MTGDVVTHVLFDFDGTLINSVDELIQLVDEIIQEHSPSSRITEEIRDYVPNLHTLRNLCQLINRSLNLNINVENFVRNVPTLLAQRTSLKLMPGVEKFVKHLYQHNIPMAISSGTIKPYYTEAIKHFGDFFHTYFHHVICAFDDPRVIHKKPAPDTYIVASELFDSRPNSMRQVLIFEDSITGLEGALASGAKTVFVQPDKRMFTKERASILKQVDLVLDSLENFHPEHFGLPAYDTQTN